MCLVVVAVFIVSFEDTWFLVEAVIAISFRGVENDWKLLGSFRGAPIKFYAAGIF